MASTLPTSARSTTPYPMVMQCKFNTVNEYIKRLLMSDRKVKGVGAGELRD